MINVMLSRAEGHLNRGLGLVEDVRGLLMSQAHDTIEDTDAGRE